jgi:hypothetical protein
MLIFKLVYRLIWKGAAQVRRNLGTLAQYNPDSNRIVRRMKHPVGCI